MTPAFHGLPRGADDLLEIGAGVLSVFSRTPALTAQTAAGLDALTGGRCVLGLGTSGPQVVEGFHGVPFDRPLARLRETTEICRQVWRREPVRHEGAVYPLPLPADRGTGLGRSLKLITRPPRARIPIYMATLKPKAVELTAEVAEGWYPLFFVPEAADAVWGDALAAGAARRAPDLPPLKICAGGVSAIGEGPEILTLRDTARAELALYIGGMGARGTNFYNDLFAGFGWPDAVGPGPVPRGQARRGGRPTARRPRRGRHAVRIRVIRRRADRPLPGRRGDDPQRPAGDDHVGTIAALRAIVD